MTQEAVRLDTVGRSVKRLHRPTANTYRQYAFEPVDRRRSYAYSSTQEWAAIVDHFRSQAWASLTSKAGSDDKLLAQEQEFLDKMGVCWRIKGLGTLVAEEATVNRNSEQAEALRPYIRKRALEYVAAMQAANPSDLRNMVLNAPVPIDSGKGAPFFFSGMNSEDALALAGLTARASDYDNLVAMVAKYDSSGLPPCTTTYLRTQGARKPVGTTWLEGDALVYYPDRLAMLPKHRPVNGVSFQYNLAVVPIGAISTFYRKALGYRNTGEQYESRALALAFKYTRATDKAKYDKSVSYECAIMFNEEFVTVVANAAYTLGALTKRERDLAISTHYAIQHMPELRPPARKDEMARLVDLVGTIRSGEILTSTMGTEIGRAQADAKCDMLGISDRVVVINQGDDTIAFSNDESALEKYVAAGSFFGFDEEPAPDASFLQRRQPQGYTYIGRMLDRTVNREPRYEPATVFEAALGLKTRSVLLKGHPCEGDFLSIVNSAPSEALQLAADIARKSSLLDLVGLAVSAAQGSFGAGGKGRKVALIEAVNEALSAGEIDPASAAAARAALESMVGRSTVAYGQLISDAMLVEEDALARRLRKEAENVDS